MYRYSVQDFDGVVDSLYRLVICGARRATQLSKPETRPLAKCGTKKPTIVALEEILQGKVECSESLEEDENLFK